MGNMDSKIIEEIVRNVLLEMNKGQQDFIKETDKSGVSVIKTETVRPGKFDTGKDGDKVYLKDVLTVKESPRLGCGVMEMDTSTFDWTLKYDEVDYIIEGTLEIIVGDRKITGEKGDIIFIPKNTSIKFSAPCHTRFLYVVYPANWDEL
ncbi:Ethanolamine utilization protein [Petrocella atlantisensis]|uniref:Ethanolamine utilization protein n=1 Tax=Petrocella atlantisensis TaxID=2173034 RepID=A0A3P7S120_9FIRM|nr:cupin domain-containing protein [Petrocella atlantisensis]VDN48402.1 Ethanolamine utilization protein [Petrocella atlantisensis]